MTNTSKLLFFIYFTTIQLGLLGNKSLLFASNNTERQILHLLEYADQVKGTMLTEALSAISLADELLLTNKNDKLKALTLKAYGDCNIVQGDHQKAADYYNQVLAFKDIIAKDPLLECNLRQYLCLAYRERGLFGKAWGEAEKGINLAQKHKLREAEAEILMELGALHRDLREFDVSLKFFSDAIEICQPIKCKKIAYALSNKGLALIKLNRIKEAAPYMQKSIQAVLASNDVYLQSFCLNQMGKYYSAIDSISLSIKKFEKAKEILKKAGSYRRVLARTYFNTANAYLHAGLYKKAIKNAELSLTISNEIEANHVVSYLYQTLSSSHRGLNNHKKALLYLQKYNALTDTMFDKKIGELSAQYLLQQKEKTLILQQIKIEAHRNKIIALLFGFVAILIISIMLFINTKNRKETNVLLQKQKEEIIKQANKIDMAVTGGEIGVWELDLSTDMCYLNHEFCKFLHLAKDTTIHLDDMSKLVVSNTDSIRNKLQYLSHSSALDGFLEEEVQFKDKEGLIKWGLVKGKVAERDKTNTPLILSGTCINITQKKKAELYLQEKKNYYMSLIKNNLLPVAIIDANSHFIEVNAALIKFFNIPENELRNITFCDLMKQDCFPDFPKIVQGEYSQFEKELTFTHPKTKQKKTVWGSFSGLYNKNGQFSNAILVLHDITKKKKEELVLMANLDSRNRELASTAILLSEKDELLKQIKRSMEHVKQASKSSKLTTLTKDLESKIDNSLRLNDNWEQFKLHFDRIHPQFFIKLRSSHPSLTQSDLKYCAYVRINLHTKEIARLLNINPRSVIIAKYRLKKKIGLTPEENLHEYINHF